LNFHELIRGKAVSTMDYAAKLRLRIFLLCFKCRYERRSQSKNPANLESEVPSQRKLNVSDGAVCCGSVTQVRSMERNWPGKSIAATAPLVLPLELLGG
jgi:hypothetical protein